MTDICIIGGGAAGMAAAVCAKESNPALDVLILEKKNQLGKKILATGNGRCNLSNVECLHVEETLDFFKRLGIMTRTDDQGRIYPYTEEARAVRDGLDQRLRQLGVRVETLAEVAHVEKERNFFIGLGNKTVESHKVLIACGGKAGPTYGSTGDGFRFARKLGHRVKRLIPVLTAVEVREDVSRLSGIRAKGAVKLVRQGKEIFSEKGEIQFTGSGLSGICVFDLSRFLLLDEDRSLADGFEDYKILIDFFPDVEKLDRLLSDREKNGFTGEKLLQFMVRSPIGSMIYQSAKGDVRETAKLMHAFPLSPKGVRGWDFAQVTKGGVDLSEIDLRTMESKLVPGLYFAGEVLDYDGPCGGFNLQNAWETGMKAGKEMAK